MTLPGEGRISSWFGFLFHRQTYIDPYADGVIKYFLPPKLHDHFMAIKERPIICSSFFGLDPGVMKPPNIVCTGPHMRSDDLLIKSSAIGPELK